MRGAVVEAGPGGNSEQAQQPAAAGRENFLLSMIRMALFWYFISNMFSKKSSKDPAQLMSNLFSKGEGIDTWVYLSETETFDNFKDESALIWYESNIPYATYGTQSQRSLIYTYHPSQNAQQNGSVYAHIFVARSGYSPDPTDPAFDSSSAFHKSHSLVTFHPRPKVDRRKNLLGKSLTEEGAAAEAAEAAGAIAATQKSKETVEEDEDSEADQDQEAPVEWIAYWKPNCSINFIDDFTKYVRGSVPDPIRGHMTFDLETGNYYPTLFLNDFWLLRDKLIALNETVREVPLSLTLNTLAMWKWQMYIQMEKSFKVQASYGTMIDGEADGIKRIFLEGNPVLLGITLLVSLLHSVFDFLAFKNDIQFWNANKSMEGLSARTVVTNFVCQLIVFFYLLDNDTSWMILISAGVSCIIEFWKIGKAMHVEIDRSGRIPMVRFRDRESYANNKTKEYDQLASLYLSYTLYPLVAGYAVYALIYQTHKSWYSWLLSSLTGCVYTFGFIMMCPQLFINYKLKSVAHLPWRQMTYKFLNTIVDDLFAFVIKMPFLHRLSVFRDDIVFMVFLYQRWIYPVDKTRVNEFGFGGPEAQAPPTLEGQAPATLEASSEEQAAADTLSASSGVGITEETVAKRASSSSAAKEPQGAPKPRKGDKKSQ